MVRLIELAALALAASLQLSTGAAAQQTFPTRTVRFILPFGAASASDTAARLFADRLSGRWGKPVVVENRPGGDGLVSLDAFVGAHDDHTMWFGPAGTFNVLQKALHAKAKAESGYRFYAMYDKISREDILVHAYAQCRSNKGAPGVDGQEFADIEAYGVQRWLGELALALRQETYRPAPIRRVFIPKANGKLRPLGISTLRDRVCMTAAMLVLEPIFEADLPPEQYAYRPGRNAQQAVVEVGGLLHRGHPGETSIS